MFIETHSSPRSGVTVTSVSKKRTPRSRDDCSLRSRDQSTLIDLHQRTGHGPIRCECACNPKPTNACSSSGAAWRCSAASANASVGYKSSAFTTTNGPRTCSRAASTAWAVPIGSDRPVGRSCTAMATGIAGRPRSRSPSSRCARTSCSITGATTTTAYEKPAVAARRRRTSMIAAPSESTSASCFTPPNRVPNPPARITTPTSTAVSVGSRYTDAAVSGGQRVDAVLAGTVRARVAHDV